MCLKVDMIILFVLYVPLELQKDKMRAEAGFSQYTEMQCIVIRLQYTFP